jgi:hypothetical protein
MSKALFFIDHHRHQHNHHRHHSYQIYQLEQFDGGLLDSTATLSAVILVFCHHLYH